jgi:hypothetical protein
MSGVCLVSRAYRYALPCSQRQEAAITAQERQLRAAWNQMVHRQRCALRDWAHGRQTAMLAEARAFLDGKARTGMAAFKANERAAKEHITRDQAMALNRKEAVAKMEKWGPRRMGVWLAQEQLMSIADQNYGGKKCLLYGLVQKFSKSCENWLKLAGTAQAPCYKRQQHSVALQRQITSSTKCQVGQTSDLSAMIGPVGERCFTVWHRPLPDGAVVKQLAISGRPRRRYLVVMFTCPIDSVEKPFAPSELRAGIDTGYCCALTANDGDGQRQEYQPPLARNGPWLEGIARLHDKMDNQMRATNPHCFNDDGTWKKGRRPKVFSGRRARTKERVQRRNEKLADARRDYYHTTAYALLKKYGTLAIGTWRPPQEPAPEKPAAPGKGIARHNANRKGLDHAIASFVAIAKDKAVLSVSPRAVEDIAEPWTTQTCAVCKKITGPEKPVVNWQCSACGAKNHRKTNNAENIRLRSQAKTDLIAGLHQGVALETAL